MNLNLDAALEKIFGISHAREEIVIISEFLLFK